MSKLLTLVLCACACAYISLADTEPVYLKGRIKDNGNLLILGADNIEREAVLLTPAEYASLTNAMIYLSGLKEYREKIHGRVASRAADPETKTMVYRYADGFVWSEPMTAFSGSPARPISQNRIPVKADEKPHAMTDAQWQALKLKRAAKTTREVTATFAPGGKVQEVK